MIRPLFALLLAVAYSLSSAQVTKSGAGYLFRLKVRKGEHLRFKVPVTITGVPGSTEAPVKLDGTLSLTVKSFDKYRNASIHGVFKMKIMPDQVGDMVVSKRGQELKASKGMIGFCLLYPIEPVQVGVPFHTTVPVAIADKDLRASVGNESGTFILRGFSGKGAKRVAKLTFTVAGNRAPGGTIYVGVTDGVIRRYSTDFYVTIPGSPATDPPAHIQATVIRE